MLEGMVLFFKADPEQNYGFIQNGNGATGDNIFFHGTSRRTPQFTGGETPDLSGGWIGWNPARKGDVVYYDAEKTKRGWRAKWWCYKSEYDAVVQQIAQRRTYCLVEHRGPVKIGRLTPYGYKAPRILWAGKNLVELRARYSKRLYPLENGENLRRYFKVDTGTEWESAVDPR